MLDITQITTSPNGVPVFNASPWYPSYPIANAVAPTPINPYSTLSIPAYWRAMNFLSTNLASFGRSVHKDGAKRNADEPPHPLEKLLKRRPNTCQNARGIRGAWSRLKCLRAMPLPRMPSIFSRCSNCHLLA